MFEGPDCKLSEFQKRVHRILRVGRIKNIIKDSYMFGRILGSCTNKNIKSCADSGTPAAFIPISVAKKNKLEVFPTDLDEPSYEAATGHRLSVIGQTNMFINFKTMKKTKKLRALVVADEGDKVLVWTGEYSLTASHYPLMSMTG